MSGDQNLSEGSQGLLRGVEVSQGKSGENCKNEQSHSEVSPEACASSSAAKLGRTASLSYESLGENDDSSKRAIIPQVKTSAFRFSPIFTDFSDFLGRLQPSKTTILVVLVK